MGRKADLPIPNQQLLELMQRINFGRIENLLIRNGLPVLDGSHRVVRLVKFGSESGPRPEASRGDFALKAQAVDLFRQIAELGDGTIHCLEVKHGLPFLMQVEEGRAA